MIKAIIIEDEPKNRELLQLMLAEYCPTVQMMGTADNLERGIKLVKVTRPDVVFLDIRVPGREDGFRFFHSFQGLEMPFDVIFVTAHEEYMRRAFNQTTAVGYLLKPVDPEELIQLVFKVRQRLLAKEVSQPLIDDVKRANDVLYCYIKDDTIRIKLIDGKEKIGTSAKLEEYERYPNFVRVSRQYVINFNFVNKLTDISEDGDKLRGGIALLYNGEKIVVSVARKPNVWKQYKLLS